ncbi:hypothetical protein CK203_103491 [Vitis vinifera]|uniref:Uncharacterized protein n=1 Tax=Vitis vinifera TaxID=29760 RepID=A0A438DK02_VITVI|nr:hypothetical protein CK203_103491 [Vitis vinifera]
MTCADEQSINMLTPWPCTKYSQCAFNDPDSVKGSRIKGSLLGFNPCCCSKLTEVLCVAKDLAVYLVAQYARYEIRRMEEELELKKKQTEEEEKEKELESNAAEEIGEGSDPELLKVKVRLDKLEEAVKEIVVESKKQLDSSVAKNQDNGSKLERQPNKTSSQSRSEASNSAAKNLKSEEIAPGLSKGTRQSHYQLLMLPRMIRRERSKMKPVIKM